jgi:PII-like signaling protein
MAVAPVNPIASHPAKRLCIMLTIHDHFRHRSQMVKLLTSARRAGLAGGTVLEAQEGYGTSGKHHRTHAFYDDAPVVIVLIDRPDRIELFLDHAADLLGGLALVVSDVEVIDF